MQPLARSWRLNLTGSLPTIGPPEGAGQIRKVAIGRFSPRYRHSSNRPLPVWRDAFYIEVGSDRSMLLKPANAYERVHHSRNGSDVLQLLCEVGFECLQSSF